jgi:hypothetical protein
VSWEIGLLSDTTRRQMWAQWLHTAQGAEMTATPAQTKPPGVADAPTPKLPHERDQSEGNVATKPDPKIVQAKRDIDAGLVDTDMRATPGLDAARREQLVPTPKPTPDKET